MSTVSMLPTRDRPASTEDVRTRFPLAWLRGLAALGVLTFHAYQYHRTGAEGTYPLSGLTHELLLGTDAFVDMFFVLSSFVLWLPVARAALDGGAGRPGSVLLLRRIARLYPLYAVVVLVVWALTNPELPGHWQDLLLHLSLTQVYSDQYIFWTNGPAWSLAVEFHFYALMALALLPLRAVLQRVSSRGARLAALLVLPAACVVTGLAYLAWQTLVVQPPLEDWSVWFSPLAKAADFGIGMALAVVVAAGVRLSPARRRTVCLAGVAALAALIVARPHTGLLQNWWHPAYALAIAAALVGIVMRTGPDPAWMWWRPLAWIGGLGYGIYLIHEPVMRVLGSWGLLPTPQPGLVFVGTAVLVAIPAVALAWVSSRTLEPAGLRLARLRDERGKARDYYDHVPAHHVPSDG